MIYVRFDNFLKFKFKIDQFYFSKLPVAPCIERYCKMFASNFCQTCFRRDLSMEKFHKTPRNSSGFKRYGQHHDVI